MKKQKTKIAVVIVWLAFAFAFSTKFWATGETVGAQTVNKQIQEIEGYKNWTRVNSVPQLMPVAVSLLCRASPADIAFTGGATNPHRDKYFTVFVNDIGRKAMLERKKPKFPVGSVIVKEKLPDEQSRTPELLTVMIKQKKGFNPASGDWEYLVADGTGATIEARGKLQNCQTCHLANKKTDYVFRTYLSETDSEKLK